MNEISANARRLRFGGMARFSSVDFPGKLSAVLFSQGCPLKCPYCHNAHLQSVRTGQALMAWDEIKAFLHQRRGLLDAVVFSGGEPLMQRRLPEALQDVKAMGFETALHTSGISPKRLDACLPLLDWVAFDVKAPFWGYGEVGAASAGRAVHDSLARLIRSGVDYETRMTLYGPSIGRAAVEWACATLPVLGVEKFIIQRARNNNADDAERFYSDDGVLADRHLMKRLRATFPFFDVRDYAEDEGNAAPIIH